MKRASMVPLMGGQGMRTVSAIGFAFLAATAACADPVQTSPQPVGIAHICLDRYPAAAAREGQQGQTMLRFYIAEDGSVHDIVVVNSSGSAQLDQASIDCITPWTYKPATWDGQPIAVMWKAQIDWFLHQNEDGPEKEETPPPGAVWTEPVAVPGEQHSCENSSSVLSTKQHPVDMPWPQEASTVAYTIGEDGSTRDATLTHSSGSTVHDGYALSCVKDWHYRPALHDGKPVAIRWFVRIPWRDTEHKTPLPPPPSQLLPPEPLGSHSCHSYLKNGMPEGAAGATGVSLIITSTGQVATVRVKLSSGNVELDDAAVRCASNWRYKPGTDNGHPVPVSWSTEVNWNLQ